MPSLGAGVGEVGFHGACAQHQISGDLARGERCQRGHFTFAAGQGSRSPCGTGGSPPGGAQPGQVRDDPVPTPGGPTLLEQLCRPFEHGERFGSSLARATEQVQRSGEHDTAAGGDVLASYMITPVFEARRWTVIGSVRGLGGGPAGRAPRILLAWS
jgi:hypothetical protein